ncbi:MAG: hypothetical protein J6Y97_06525 [Prevotella sp.]|nr:hypothetical protein [Prevotella sp.]
MLRIFCFILTIIFSSTATHAQQDIDSLCMMLRDAPVQEKVYLHIDNNCYFKGDTIWYKAYTVRADSLTYTDMSRILYVELVSPDGMLVERQQIIVSDKGYSCGNFALTDTLYSGFFEIRAYTRWMLNFDVTEHPTFWKDRDYFYNREMMHDFFRMYGTIYSRVFPVYEKPENDGDYSLKYFVSRPKQRIPKEQKEKLSVSFYPEGGHLIAGTRCKVAFEAVDEEGEQVPIIGKVNKTSFSASHLGRGVFEIDVPEKGDLNANVSYQGKNLVFKLPETEKNGCSLRLENKRNHLNALIQMKGMPVEDNYLAVILCRGVLQTHTVFKIDTSGKAQLQWDSKDLKTGVNDLIVMNSQGIPLADRLFFVNNHDYDNHVIQVTGDGLDYEPYSMISVDFQAPADTRQLSISVRDRSTDDPTYDTGNIFTDLLLSSELKGFIPYPSYYFESDDDIHNQALDLLMMVQGWRRYNIEDLLENKEMRYTPEKNLSVEGTVYPTIYFDIRDFSGNEAWADDFYNYEAVDPSGQTESSGGEEISGSSKTDASIGDKYSLGKITNNENKGLKKEVTVESELILDTDVYGIEVETTDGGNFSFNIPPFYGKGILTMAAYPLDASEKKVLKQKTKGRLDEDLFPDYYIKRNLFYPVFAKKYSFYQCHFPNSDDYLDEDAEQIEVSNKISVMDKTLQEVEVKGKKKRGLRIFDYTRPLCSYDAVDLYNLVTDYGLSYGKFNPAQFPRQLSMALFGNFNTDISPVIEDGYNIYINYIEHFREHKTEEEKNQIEILKISGRDNFQGFSEPLKLKRVKTINFFSDFELRNEDRPLIHAQDQSINNSDIVIDYVTLLNDATRPTFRDRWLILPGIYEPDDFYHPDYTNFTPSSDVKDYRRTLYWNPNAILDENGQYHARFYNNGKTTRIKVSAAGLTTTGKPISNE